MTNKVFFYCVGAQKSASTWLYKYLQSHPECRLSCIKETRYFNHCENGTFNALIKRISEKNKDARIDAEAGVRRKAGYEIHEYIEKSQQYVNFFNERKLDVTRFEELLSLYTDGKKIVGEATPGYSLLSSRMFKCIDSTASPKKFAFFMRDPINRLWSQFKMLLAEQATDTYFSEEKFEEAFFQRLESRENDKRIYGISDYISTVKNLENSLGKERIYYGFFERIHSRDGETALMTEICDFLEISKHYPWAQKVVNKGNQRSMHASFGLRAMKTLHPQYSFIADKFGDVPDLWKQSINRFL